MHQAIKNRLSAVERVRNYINLNVPELVFIYWDEEQHSWTAKEQYVQKSATGKVIQYSGRVRFIKLNSPDDYQIPEGFSGVILKEGEFE